MKASNQVLLRIDAGTSTDRERIDAALQRPEISPQAGGAVAAIKAANRRSS